MIKNRFAFKWIGLSFVIKAALFILIAVLYYQNWPKDSIVNYLFIISGDTDGYYAPIESFVLTGEYGSYCRMPGLLPIYAPLYYLFGSIWGKTIVIILQFVVSTISVYVLAQTASHIFKNKNIFYVTFFLYALSTFVSNWDHYGYSDSFGISFLIFATYFAVRFKSTSNIQHLWLSGIFIAWSVFFRPVHGILVPVVLFLYVIRPGVWMSTIKYCLVFGFPLVAALSIWTLCNYRKYHKLIILQGPNSECFSALTPELLAVRGLIIGWGGDYQPWSKGSEAEWFFEKKVQPVSESISPDCLTASYNYDSLLVLRNEYRLFVSDTLPEETKKVLSRKIIQKSTRYLNSYKKEKKFRYYFLNRLRILRQLLLPQRLDNFPTPAFSKMTIFHKLLKGSYYLFFLFISVTGLVGSVFQLFKKNYFVLIPVTLLVVIGGVLGYVEQRYLGPVYPYFVIFSAALLCWGRDKLFDKKFREKILK